MDRHHYEIFTKFGDEGFLLHLDNARGWDWTRSHWNTTCWLSSQIGYVSVAPPHLVCAQVWKTFQGWDVHPGTSVPVLRVSLKSSMDQILSQTRPNAWKEEQPNPAVASSSQLTSWQTYMFHVSLTQDKELHAAAPPAAGPAGVQA